MIYTDFCIAVESIGAASSYTLKVFPFISESLYLTFRFPETSYLEPYEIHNYQLILYGRKNLNFTLSLHKKFGDATIAVRKCNHRNRMLCKISIEDLRDKSLFLFLDKSSLDVSYDVKHLGDDCRIFTKEAQEPTEVTDAFPSCCYSIAIYNPTIYRSSYTIRADKD